MCQRKAFVAVNPVLLPGVFINKCGQLEQANIRLQRHISAVLPDNDKIIIAPFPLADRESDITRLNGKRYRLELSSKASGRRANGQGL